MSRILDNLTKFGEIDTANRLRERVRNVAPRLLDVAERMGEKAKVVEIDIDREKELAERYRIQSVPTFIIFKNGEQLWRQSGAISTIALIQLLTDYQ